jgi:hypothetical protein
MGGSIRPLFPLCVLYFLLGLLLVCLVSFISVLLLLFINRLMLSVFINVHFFSYAPSLVFINMRLLKLSLACSSSFSGLVLGSTIADEMSNKLARCCAWQSRLLVQHTHDNVTVTSATQYTYSKYKPQFLDADSLSF